MSFCTKCGLEAESKDAFCAACGQPIRQTVNTSVRPQGGSASTPEPPRIQVKCSIPSESRTCPHCGLVNPSTATACDCGYHFDTLTIAAPSMDVSVQRIADTKHQNRVGAIIRDVLIIFVLTGIGGFVVGLAHSPSDNFRFLIGLGCANFFLGIVGFTISGCLAHPPRWRHLRGVALWTWIISLLNVVFVDVSFAAWVGSAMLVAAMMGIGGAISYLFKRDSKRMQPVTSMGQNPPKEQSQVSEEVPKQEQNPPPVITFTAKTTHENGKEYASQTPPSAKQTDKVVSGGGSRVFDGGTDAGDQLKCEQEAERAAQIKKEQIRQESAKRGKTTATQKPSNEVTGCALIIFVICVISVILTLIGVMR